MSSPLSFNSAVIVGLSSMLPVSGSSEIFKCNISSRSKYAIFVLFKNMSPALKVLITHLSTDVLCIAEFDGAGHRDNPAKNLRNLQYHARFVDWWGLVPDLGAQSRYPVPAHDQTNPS